MPVEVGIWKLGDRPVRLDPTPLDAESRLEDMIAADPDVLAPGLLVLGRQIATPHGGFVDLLCLDREGRVHVVELKRGKTPREVVAQALDYASWAQGLDYAALKGLFEEKHPGVVFEQAFEDRFGGPPPEDLNESHEIVVVSSQLDPSTERIIGYLADTWGLPVNAVFFRCFRDGPGEYLTRTWLIDPAEIDTKPERVGSGPVKKKEKWDGRSFYVNFGADDNRSWADARRYGFVSAGGGKWYSQTLYNLEPGHRIFVNVPPKRYVAVGEVTGTAQPLRDFKVDVEGRRLPLVEAPRQGYRTDAHIDDDMCEHLVPVRWLADVPLEEGFWEKGLFAIQSSACKLRNQFTIERVLAHFGLEK